MSDRIADQLREWFGTKGPFPCEQYRDEMEDDVRSVYVCGKCDYSERDHLLYQAFTALEASLQARAEAEQARDQLQKTLDREREIDGEVLEQAVKARSLALSTALRALVEKVENDDRLCTEEACGCSWSEAVWTAKALLSPPSPVQEQP